MPFQDNSTMRPLMDQVEGGPPAAWKCLLTKATTDGHKDCPDCEKCGKVTSSLSGMISHQKQVHNFEPQMEIKHEK